jgi:hypothetical protein
MNQNTSTANVLWITKKERKKRNRTYSTYLKKKIKKKENLETTFRRSEQLFTVPSSASECGAPGMREVSSVFPSFPFVKGRIHAIKTKKVTVALMEKKVFFYHICFKCLFKLIF